MKLYELATVIRSKNAGPFTLTLDMFFETEGDMELVLNDPGVSRAAVAALYRVEEASVRIHPFRRIRAIKITFPRPIGSGAPGDRDVYGSAQHVPLADINLDRA